MVYKLDPDAIEFPDPRDGDADGLFAIGGDLSAERLMLAYSLGIFPWFSFRDSDEPWWYCPMERFVIFPKDTHISHSMRTMMNKGIFSVTFNKDFKGVIEGCSEKRIDLEGAWLGADIIKAYSMLHDLGFAASVEVWKGDNLVGGLYGVTIGTTFCGESMFSREPGASKLALISLAKKMDDNGGKMIDCQFETPHLKSMGGCHITYDQYLATLRNPSWI